MEIIQKQNVSIITPFSPRLDKRRTESLMNKILACNTEIAINLDYVSDCTIEFIEALKNVAKTKKIGIFNIPSDVFTLFNIMNIDKSIALYTSELDYEENRHQLINRKFNIV